MAECSGSIAFEQKVASPGKAIGDRDPKQGPPGMTEGKGHNHRQNPQRRTARMHDTVAGIAVLFKIEAEEFVVTGKSLLLRHIRKRLAPTDC